MTPKTKPKKTETDNPLWGYETAMRTLVGIAQGRIRSQMRLDAAREILEHTAIPPTVGWDFEDEA